MITDNFKFDSVESGLCRIYYRDGKDLFCYMEEMRGQFYLYICTPSGEPSHTVGFHEKIMDTEHPDFSLTCSLTTRFVEWLLKQQLKVLGAMLASKSDTPNQKASLKSLEFTEGQYKDAKSLANDLEAKGLDHTFLDHGRSIWVYWADLEAV